MIILVSGIGGPGLMALTALFVGVFWALNDVDGESDVAKELGLDDMSAGRTLLHKMLGGKGKK